jgi:DNA-binding transcriptional LysR family regulator
VAQSLLSLDRLAQAALDIRQAQAGRLSIATHPWAAISLLPPVAAAFLRERPGVAIRFISRSSQAIRQLIPAQAFDIGIAEVPVENAAVEVERFRLRCVAMLPARHRLAAEPVITPRLLDGQPFIAMFREHMLFHAVARAFDEAGARWNVVAETEFFATACALVGQGAGLCVVDPLTAADHAGRRVVARPFAPVLHYEVALFRPAGRQPSRLAQDFAAAVRARLAPHIETRGDGNGSG